MTKIISIVGGMQPSAPTIGTATAGNATATVTYTPSTYIGKGTISYTATSSPGNLTGTGSSPITVSGLTNGTAYTFTVTGTTNYGVSSIASAASNSITPAAPVNSYESIATVSVGSGGASSITFSSIPQTFTHLQLRYISKDARNNSDNSPVDLRFNGSSATAYNKHFMEANGTTTSASSELNQTFIRLEGAGNLAPTQAFGIGVTEILDYASTSKTKTILQVAGIEKGGAGFSRINTGQWFSTNAINSITLTPLVPNFSQYSHFALYGIKEA